METYRTAFGAADTNLIYPRVKRGPVAGGIAFEEGR